MAMKLKTRPVVRAIDYMPLVRQAPDDGEPAELLFSEETDGVLMRLFGMVPEYTNPKLEALWREVNSAGPEEIFTYCREHGVDVLDDDGRPVPPWRDIAVILKAVDQGVLQRG